MSAHRIELTACCFKLSLNFAGGSNQLKGFFGHFAAWFLPNDRRTDINKYKKWPPPMTLTDFNSVTIPPPPLLEMIEYRVKVLNQTKTFLAQKKMSFLYWVWGFLLRKGGQMSKATTFDCQSTNKLCQESNPLQVCFLAELVGKDTYSNIFLLVFFDKNISFAFLLTKYQWQCKTKAAFTSIWPF